MDAGSALVSSAIAVAFVGAAMGAGAEEFSVPKGWITAQGNEGAPGEQGYRIELPNTGVEMVWVPGGRFRMGSDSGDPDEQPVHEVEVGGFWIGRTEVTVGQWSREVGDVPFPEQNSLGDDHPIVLVFHEQCVEFCEALGLRLPSEAEWEYAARAGTTTHTYNGDLDACNSDASALPPIAWYSQTSSGHTHVVGELKANDYGLHDMLGNVFEWVMDTKADYPVGPLERIYVYMWVEKGYFATPSIKLFTWHANKHEGYGAFFLE